MTLWFGQPWPHPEWRAPICEDDALRIPTPLGSSCMHCDELIDEHDRGLAMGALHADGSTGVVYSHIECNLRHVMGCSASLRGEPHDHDVPYRQDARRVQAWLAGQEPEYRRFEGGTYPP